MEDTSKAFWCRHSDNGCSVLVVVSLVLCQGLAGPWYARRERVAVKAMGSVVQWFEDSDEGTSPNWTEDERKQWIAGSRQRQD